MLLLIDGFDSYGTTIGSAPSPAGILARKYVDTLSESTMRIETGRFGGYSLRFYSGVFRVGPQSLTTDATMIVGMALKFANCPSRSVFLTFYDGTNYGVSLWVTVGGELVVTDRAGTQLAITSGLGLLSNVWYYIEMKVVCGVSGSFELHVGGGSVLSGVGDTRATVGHDYNDGFRLCQYDYSSLTFYFDDLYCLDGSGLLNNDFLGVQKVTTLFPDGVGSANEWTGSGAADHYTYVNELVCDDDTTYVESLVAAQKELWAYQSITDVGSIAGLQISVDCRETDANPFNLITVVKTASESDNVASLVGTSSWITKQRLLETDPADSIVWDETKINSAQFGVKVG